MSVSNDFMAVMGCTDWQVEAQIISENGEAMTVGDKALASFNANREVRMEGEVVVSASGATSTKLEEAWHLIPFAAIKSMARRFWVGSVKHAPRNWERGDETFAEIRLSHCYRHMALFAEFRRQEDLDAVLCNAAMLAYWKERGLLKERTMHDTVLDTQQK